MTIDKQIEILVAAKAGKAIQLSSRDCNPRNWIGLSNQDHQFNFFNYDYRLKPEPLVFYANVYRDEEGEHIGGMAGTDREEVVKSASVSAVRRGAKFVEVVE